MTPLIVTDFADALRLASAVGQGAGEASRKWRGLAAWDDTALDSACAASDAFLRLCGINETTQDGKPLRVGQRPRR